MIGWLSPSQPARAESISRTIPAWPLLYYRPGVDASELDILWPLLRYEREGAWTRYALRPYLFSIENNPLQDFRRVNLLWKLSAYERHSQELSFHVFPLYWYHTSPSSEQHVIFPLYPLFRYRHDQVVGELHLHAPWPVFNYQSKPGYLI